MDTQNSATINARKINERNRKIGLFFITGPVIGLFLVLTIWAVTSFTIARMMQATPTRAVYVDPRAVSQIIPADPNTQWAITVRIINTALGFIGFICLIGIPVGIPVGLIFLSMKEPTETDKKE